MDETSNVRHVDWIILCSSHYTHFVALYYYMHNRYPKIALLSWSIKYIELLSKNKLKSKQQILQFTRHANENSANDSVLKHIRFDKLIYGMNALIKSFSLCHLDDLNAKNIVICAMFDLINFSFLFFHEINYILSLNANEQKACKSFAYIDFRFSI